jgi:RNA polymerase sigma-70 factor, ECF subfamily
MSLAWITSALPGCVTATKLASLERARAGDRAALESVLRHHRRAIERMCTRMCSGAAEHTDDVIQDTYLAIVRNIASFRGQASFLTWAYTIARTAHGRRRRRAALAIVSGHLVAPAANSRPLDEVVAASKLGETICAALTALSETDRRVLLMRDLEGWSAHEVAERTGLTVPAVKTRLHRARVAMRSRLACVAHAA